jgi:hypothetical protein
MKKRLIAVVAAARTDPVFHPFVVLAHNPCLSILIETVLSVPGVEEVHVLVCPEHWAAAQAEVNRRFSEAGVRVHADGWSLLCSFDEDDRILVVQAEFPLLSRITLLDLTRQGQDEAFFLGSRLRNHALYTALETDNDRRVLGFRLYPNNNQEGSTCFLGAAVVPVRRLLPLVGLLEEDPDNVVAAAPSRVFWVSPGIASKECAVLRTAEDKNYLEEVYMENRNADFIYQFYTLWKRCSMIESRLETLEEKIHEKN